ncbi:molybdate transport repressor ModE-like protein [Sulfitobacter undariae]|uniref:Molybdate transport repressor ModE-like protein n=1 Tax=Sulfitobacter undariae TaxID=1563671 RepID=A0A7W6GYS6_9RHOB|nr:LysR family transcriptional regulator [Sulfitobacter undariae]MBB3993136.1 molybdate transport repressor ModE-like protein [Sulfitobacter undariae]
MKRLSSSQIRVFNEIASQGSFSDAARVLGVSQPAITAHIRTIEKAYDVKLFERTGAGAVLTQIGRRLFQRTASMRDTEREAAEILSRAHMLEVGELSIACGAAGPAMQLVSRFQKSYPGVRLQLLFGNWQEVVNAVRYRKVDLGLLTDAPDADDIIKQPFTTQKIVALVPKDHPLAQRRKLSLEELVGEPILFRTGNSQTQRAVDAVLKKYDLNIRPLLVLEAREAIYEACAQGVGIGFMFDAASTRRDGVVRIPVTQLPETHSEDVFCLASKRKLRATDAFFSMVK